MKYISSSSYLGRGGRRRSVLLLDALETDPYRLSPSLRYGFRDEDEDDDDDDVVVVDDDDNDDVDDGWWWWSWTE